MAVGCREKVRERSTWNSVLLDNVPEVATISIRRVNDLLCLDDRITALEVTVYLQLFVDVSHFSDKVR